MSYPTYTPPAQGSVTMAFGSGPAQPIPVGYLCHESDAQLVASAFGGTLVNPATTPSLSLQFGNLEAGSDVQPWWIAGIPSPGFAGPEVQIMWGPNAINGGGVGNPGAWSNPSGGNPKWLPTAPPVVVPPPVAPVNDSGDAQSFLATLVGNGLGLTTAQAASLSNIERLTIAVAKVLGIS